MNRLHLKYAGRGPYKDEDFLDVVKELQEKSMPEVRGGNLYLSAGSEEFTFDRDGKPFAGVMMVLMGQVVVIVQEAD